MPKVKVSTSPKKTKRSPKKAEVESTKVEVDAAKIEAFLKDFCSTRNIQVIGWWHWKSFNGWRIFDDPPGIIASILASPDPRVVITPKLTSITVCCNEPWVAVLIEAIEDKFGVKLKINRSFSTG